MNEKKHDHDKHEGDGVNDASNESMGIYLFFIV
jgi:hypothetical protein